MEWLLHNPIAEMYGPNFLLLYGMVGGITIAACWLALRWGDWTGALPLPPVPSTPDSYEIAYLRGGENEVARAVLVALVQQGYLRIDRHLKEAVFEPVPEAPNRRALSPIERRALDWFKLSHKVSEVFEADGLARQLKPFCAAYESKLSNERLLTPPDVKAKARLCALAGALIIGGLGGYKLIVALLNNRFNVFFLLLIGVASLIVLLLVCRAPRLSRRGRAYLERLQTAFDRLRWSVPTPAVAATVSGRAAEVTAFDPTLPLVVGLFGVGALAGTAYDDYHYAFRKSAEQNQAAGGGSCGSSCGSTSSSSDGGNSSCSSGSSCGGGGCGGCGGD